MMIYGFNERFREALKEKNMKICDCAERTGITRSTIDSYLNGGNSPSGNALLKIAQCLNVSSDWLLGLSDEKKRAPAKAAERVPEKETAQKAEPKTVIKTVIVTGKMKPEDMEIFVSEYIGLTRFAVRAMHKSSGFKIKWKRNV